MLSLIPVESKDSPDSSKLFFTYPNVTSSVCPGFYANTKLSDDPRKDEIFVAKLDGDDHPCTIIQNIVTCYIDHSMYDGEEFDGISIVSTNSSQTIAQKGEFGLHYVGMYKNTIIQFFYDLFSKFSNSALCTIFIFFFNYNMLKKNFTIRYCNYKINFTFLCRGFWALHTLLQRRSISMVFSIRCREM